MIAISIRNLLRILNSHLSSCYIENEYYSRLQTCSRGYYVFKKLCRYRRQLKMQPLLGKKHNYLEFNLTLIRQKRLLRKWFLLCSRTYQNFQLEIKYSHEYLDASEIETLRTYHMEFNSLCSILINNEYDNGDFPLNLFAIHRRTNLNGSNNWWEQLVSLKL